LTYIAIGDKISVMAIDHDYTWAELGGRIRDRRQSRGLTQQALASAAGLTQNGICRLEAGEVNPQLATLKKVADALECSVRDLVCGIAESDAAVVRQVRRIKRILESGNTAARLALENGIGTAELLVNAGAQQIGRRGMPPIRLKGEGRRNLADDLPAIKTSAAFRLSSESIARPYQSSQQGGHKTHHSVLERRSER
jgi:transcriptional regulator with XRE-family HTH domain